MKIVLATDGSDHFKQLEESIDEVAERISKLGSKAIGTMEEFGKLSAQ